MEDIPNPRLFRSTAPREARAALPDVQTSRAVRQAEVGAARTMLERTEERFGLKPQRLAGDTAYGAAPMLNWLVEEKQIAPHMRVFDRSKREDGPCREKTSGTTEAPTPTPAQADNDTPYQRTRYGLLSQQCPRLRQMPVQTHVLSKNAAT